MAMVEEATVSKTSLHLICNAHLDPVWLWEWEEGAAAAISTFRTAADLCEEFDGFVFNHNEVILYQWVEEYEPALFARIQRWCKRAGGTSWAAGTCSRTATCPAGESLRAPDPARPALLRREVRRAPDDGDQLRPLRPHARAGADPGQERLRLATSSAGRASDQVWLPADDFVWVGYDGSRGDLARRRRMTYHSALGKADEKVAQA